MSGAMGQTDRSVAGPGFAGPLNRSRQHFLIVLCVAMIFLCSALFLKIIPGAAGVTANRAFAVMIFLAGGWFILSRGAATAPAMRSPLVLLVMILPFAAVLWSGSRGETLKVAVTLGGVTTLAVLAGSYLSLRQLCMVVAMATAVQAFLGLALVFGMPSLGKATSGPLIGSWIGVFAHKNGFGQAGATGMLCAIFALASARWSGPMTAALVMALLLNTIALAGSNSVTSYLVALSAVLVGLTTLALQRGVRLWSRLFVIALLGMPLLAYLFWTSGLAGDLFSALGKRQDLSSRLPIWQLSIEFIKQRPILGWGPGWFWQSNLDVDRIFMAALHFKPFYAHNGMLETWLNYGLVGVLSIGALLLSYLRLAVRVTVRTIRAHPESGILLAFLVYIVLLNITESTFFSLISIPWLLLIALYVVLLRATDELGLVREAASGPQPRLKPMHPSPARIVRPVRSPRMRRVSGREPI